MRYESIKWKITEMDTPWCVITQAQFIHETETNEMNSEKKKKQ